jgi:hypothetical protein
MTKIHRISLVLFFISSACFVIWGSSLERSSAAGMADFKAVFYAARCLIHRTDPYKEDQFWRVYQAENGEVPSDPALYRQFRRAVPICINLPSALFLVVPLAMLPWGIAHLIWMMLIISSLEIAAFLMWRLAANVSPGMSIFLVCVLLANSEIALMSGNLAAIAVGLCVIAVWCFVRERFAWAGVLCLAVSLALKPHDGGLVWLYFLLAGGAYRKRALQTLLVTIALSLGSVAWVSNIAPDWVPELRANILATTAHGDISDPGPDSVNAKSPTMVIDLQAALSIFDDDPHIYNPISYAVCGALLLLLFAATLKSRHPESDAWFALAAISALTMLVTYHRPYDAKLLLLSIPACAILSAEGGLTGWLAAMVTSAGVVLTGDISLAILLEIAKKMNVNTATFVSKVLTLAFTRPASVILLVLAIFYLWVYVRRVFNPGQNASIAPPEIP